MKKMLLGTLTVLVLTTGAMATENFFNYKQEVGIGASYIDRNFDGWDNNNYGFNLNGKLMKSLNEIIAVGVTVNFDYNPSVKLTSGVSNPTEYMLDFLPTVTYIINDKVDVSAMIGYEYGKYNADWGDWNTQGLSYGVTASYVIMPQIRANISVLRASMDFTTSTPGAVDDNNVQTTRYTIGVGYNF